jgi:hypothetical protein
VCGFLGGSACVGDELSVSLRQVRDDGTSIASCGHVRCSHKGFDEGFQTRSLDLHHIVWRPRRRLRPRQQGLPEWQELNLLRPPVSLARSLPDLVRCGATVLPCVCTDTNVCMAGQTETTTLLPERCAPTILTHSPTVVSSEAPIEARDTQSG